MRPIATPQSAPSQDSGPIMPDVRGHVVRSMLKRGSLLGVLVGIVTGTYTASRLLYGTPGGEFGALVLGPIIGAAAGLFFGLCIALVDALLLVSLAPAVRSGNLRATWAAALAAFAAVALILGVTLLFIGGAWSGALADPLVMALWVVSAWLGGMWFGISALYSSLNPPRAWRSPLPANPRVPSEDE